MAGNGKYQFYDRNYVVVKGTDKLGRMVNSSVVFAQNWENGSRMVIVASNGKNSMINPANPYFFTFMLEAANFCLNRVFISFLEPEFACYKRGENVRAKYVVTNFHNCSKKLGILINIRDEHGNGFEKSEIIEIDTQSSICGEINWMQGDFESDYYDIEARAIIDDRVVSKAYNGFVVRNEEVAVNGPKIEICGKYFFINGRQSAITGTNYYESGIGELMWIRPDIGKLKKDLKDMADSGINEDWYKYYWLRIIYSTSEVNENG